MAEIEVVRLTWPRLRLVYASCQDYFLKIPQYYAGWFYKLCADDGIFSCVEVLGFPVIFLKSGFLKSSVILRDSSALNLYSRYIMDKIIGGALQTRTQKDNYVTSPLLSL